MASGPIISWQIDGETVETVEDFILGGSQITADGDYSHEIKRHLLLGRKAMTNLDSMLKSKDFILPTKMHLVKAMVFSSSHVWMWKLDYKESWAPQNWCFWTVMLEKTLESPLDSKEIQPVHPKGNQSWIYIGRTDVETETPILWPPDGKNWLIEKDPGAGKDWRQEEKGTNREWDGWMASLTQWTWVWAISGSWCWTGSLECCSPWGHKESDMTEWLNWNWLSPNLWRKCQILWTLSPLTWLCFSLNFIGRF